ncbi:YfhE family protein [Neobacillus notoginsengisoli]|uniref:YfhE family protein n=1 Tax=Neobacillus notoginsengisoli TaxID=1578198 RepID=A0A417YK05_9BACI|nr:YfhE family protein [Neobacillus notoginsengisoli]RHW33352.1 YfhE family protein [Neobacillus notoginsengisoli]
MEKKKKDKMRLTLTSTQEVLYQREFKAADRAAGFEGPKLRKR